MTTWKGLVPSRWSDCEATSVEESRGGGCHVYAPPRGDNKTLRYPDISTIYYPLYIILLLDHDSDIYILHLSRPPAPPLLPPPALMISIHHSRRQAAATNLGENVLTRKFYGSNIGAKSFNSGRVRCSVSLPQLRTVLSLY